jgi:hypothetical protein
LHTFDAGVTLGGGTLNLPPTTGPTAGIIVFGGAQFLHNYGTDSVFLGGAGNFSLTGAGNIGIGAGVLASVTSGAGNIGVGLNALANFNGAFTGSGNVAIGGEALVHATSASYQIAIGPFALAALTSNANPNVAIGLNALAGLTSGGFNIAIGHATAQFLTTGTQNIALGYLALQNATDADNCIAIGYNALNSYASGANYNVNSIAIGTLAMFGNTSGYECVAIGTSVLQDQTTGYWNVAIGIQSMQSLTTGYSNTGVGLSSFDALTTGYGNTGIGQNVGYQGGSSDLTTGTYCTFVGFGAILGSSTQRNYTTVIGANATAVLFDNSITLGRIGTDTVYGGVFNVPNTTNALTGVIQFDGTRFLHNYGTHNTFIGAGSGNFSTTGANNIGLGMATLAANTSGNYNVAIGSFALLLNTSGVANVASGYGTLQVNTTGNFNVAEGYTALTVNSTGSNNTSVGGLTLPNATTANNNTAIGFEALLNVTTGANNTAIGAIAGNGITTGSNNTIVGRVSGLSPTLAGTIIFGDGAGNIRLDYGHANASTWTFADAVNFPGVSTTASGANAFLDNTASNNLLRSTSSLRYKTAVRPLALAAALPVLDLTPIRFRSLADADDPNRDFEGLAAEEVAARLPQFVNFTTDGLPDGVQYDRIAAVALLAVVKDQQARIAALEARLPRGEEGFP